MKLVVLTVVLILHISWQQDSLETLNDTLEKLIRQTEPVEQIDSSEKNHSRILYYSNPAGKTKKSHRRMDKNDPYKMISHSLTDIDNQVSVADLLEAIGLGPSKTGQNVDKDQVLKDIALTVEQGVKVNSKFDIDDLKELLEKPTFMEKKPSKEENIPEEDIIRRASKTENDLLNKYPEIIVDRITYPNKTETANITKTVTVITEETEGQENEGFDRNFPMELAIELKSLLSEVQKMKTVETITNDGHSKQLQPTILTQHFHGTLHQPTNGSPQQSTHGSPQQPTHGTSHQPTHGSPQQSTHGSPQQLTHGSPQQPTHDSPQQPTHGSPQRPTHGSPQPRTHGSPCGNVHRPYASPCALSPSFDRSSGPHLGANMQANTWGAHNTRQMMLMRISREQKLNRIRFITDLINNMMSRFVYRPLYGKK